MDLNEDVSYRTMAAGICGIVISALFFAGRAASRWITKQRLGLSDYLLMFGMICGWGISAMMIYGSTQGLGRHLEAVAATDPTLAGPTRIQQGLIAVECLYVASLGSIKISFLVLYQNLFPGKTIRILTQVTSAIVIAWAIAIFWTSIFTCNPVRAFWDFSLLPTAKCINTVQFYIGIWVPNIVTDLIILLLPQTRIWKLQVGLKSKIALGLMFLLGSVVMIASIVRFTTLFAVDFADSTWTISTLGVWTCIELLVAVASASMPMMRPLYQLVVPTAWRFALHSSKSRESDNKNFDGAGSSERPGYGGSSRARGETEFERLADEEEGSHSFAMGAVRGGWSNGERIMVKGPEQDNILVTKSWSARSQVGP